jgi:ABC-type multidrug transport system ATPase subunit
VDNLLTDFNLALQFDQTVDQLSKFKQRKLSLAMAVAGSP